MKDRRLSDFRRFGDADFAPFSVSEEVGAVQENFDLVNFDSVFASHRQEAGQVRQVGIYSHFAPLEFQN